MLLSLLMAVLAEGDGELVERLQRRDHEALAEDLVQETFLRVWNRAQGFDAQRGALGPWLLAVARNRAIDYLRSAGGKMRGALELEETAHPSLYLDLEKEVLNSDKA